jgi:hypothetical protein
MIAEKFVEEFIEEGKNAGTKVTSLDLNEAKMYKSMIINKYHPSNTWSHLSIDDNLNSEVHEIPIEYEFTYSKSLPKEPVFIFFSQSSEGIKNIVLEIENGRKVGELMNHEYFLSNENGDYLISVNYYGIQYKGDNPEWFDELENTENSP